MKLFQVVAIIFSIGISAFVVAEEPQVDNQLQHLLEAVYTYRHADRLVDQLMQRVANYSHDALRSFALPDIDIWYRKPKDSTNPKGHELQGYRCTGGKVQMLGQGSQKGRSYLTRDERGYSVEVVVVVHKVVAAYPETEELGLAPDAFGLYFELRNVTTELWLRFSEQNNQLSLERAIVRKVQGSQIYLHGAQHELKKFPQLKRKVKIQLNKAVEKYLERLYSEAVYNMQYGPKPVRE